MTVEQRDIASAYRAVSDATERIRVDVLRDVAEFNEAIRKDFATSQRSLMDAIIGLRESTAALEARHVEFASRIQTLERRIMTALVVLIGLLLVLIVVGAVR